jgi:hypothetical protein
MYFDNVYTEQKQPNGDILLVKKNLYTDKTVAQRQPNGDILLKTITQIYPDDIKEWKFAKSKIQKAIFNDDYRAQLINPSFKTLYEIAHEYVNDGAQIIKHSILNIKTTEYTEKGFKWYPDLGISVQGVSADKSLLETVTQCQKNDISLELNVIVQSRAIRISV